MAFTVPGYRVDRLLGMGSQGEVWLGQQLATGDRVALKRLAAGSVAAAGRAEAALLAALDHPNLIALRACLPLETGLVLVLELAEAGSLAALLARRRRLTPPEVVAAISPVAAALAHAHDAGVLHGDVSAANILFSRAGRPKLADLGVARLLAAIAGSPAANSQAANSQAANSLAANERPAAGEPPAGAASAGVPAALGTPAYLDPTIAAGGAAGLASDVFSLGAVALHTLTGAGPWQAPGEPAPSAERALAVAASGTVAGLAERLAAVPPAMAGVLIRALDPAPHRRGTAAELALDLRASLPPARLELTGGRIARPAGQQSRSADGLGARPDRQGSPAFEMVPLESVPIDLTRIAPSRPPTDIAAMLRAGAAAPPPSDAAPGRWARFRATGSRSRARLVAAGLRCRTLAARQRSRPAGRHRPAASATRRSGVARPVAGLLAAGLLVAGCVLGLPQVHRRPAAAGPDASATQRGSAPPPAGSHVAGAPPSSPATADPTQVAGQARLDAGRLAAGAPVTDAQAGDQIRSAADAARVLAELAAVRERAYAERRPELLAGVYASAALLAGDTQQLYRSVPVGCGLTGVRTGYRELSLVPGAGGRSGADAWSVAVSATASLPSAVLTCRHAVRGQTRPTGPIPLRLVLTDAGRGWRIASERPG